MAHFHSFTADGMRRLGEELSAQRHRRAESQKQARDATFTTLSDFRKKLEGQAQDRQKRAAQEADARRLFMSELKSGVHAFMNRCGLNRAEMASDLRAMAGELNAAKQAWQNRPR
jgi:hypothetical protein